MASLPCGVLSHIFDGLGPRDLASASCVCKGWRRLVALEAAANQVWRSFYSARWQLSGALWPVRPSANPTTTRGASAAPAGTGAGAGISASKPISVPVPVSNNTSIGPVDSGSLRVSGSSSVASAFCGSSGGSGAVSSPSASSALTTPSSSLEMRWQWAYGTKMLRLRSWSGRYSADQVVGHKTAVRAVRLLPSCDLMATASLDRTVRLWDLRSGLPLGHSRPHGGTVRCLALDTGLLASGSSDSLVRVWRPQLPASTATVAASSDGAAPMPLFHISSKPYILRGHDGPVSCLALDESLYGSGGGSGEGVYGGTLFSGSWDCTVRVWRQGCDSSDGGGGDADDDDGGGVFAISGSSGDETASGAAGAAAASGGGSRRRRAGAVTAAAAPGAEDGGWACGGVLQYNDWVYCCAVRGGNLLVAAGSEVVVTDAVSGRAVRRFADLHDGGAVACLEGCRSGRLLFTASGDGLLLAHDLRMKQGSRVLWHHNAAVTGLAFEDPWLASSSADGCIILQDSEQALAGGGSPPRALSATCRALHCPAGQPALCLDLADQWLAAGTESGVVRLWDFTGAAAAAERAAASRAARSAAKANRAAARQQQQQHKRAQPPPPLPLPAQGPQLEPQPQALPQRQRRHRSRHHHHYNPQQQHLSEAAAQGGLGRDPLAVAWAAADAAPAPHPSKRRGGGGGSSSGDASLPQPSAADGPSAASTSTSRRSGNGGGSGSSDRWRHGHGHPQHPAFSRARVPKPPPPVAPTFRYVGSGAGSGGNVGGGASSGMATISGGGLLRGARPQRP